KPCPEKTRPHKTRCDAYFKCKVLPSKSHVWVPEKCDEGLIYEPNLKICVLPGDDWECTLGETNIAHKDDDNTIYNLDILNKVTPKIENNEALDQIEIIESGSNDIKSSSEEETLEPTIESSGDGAEEVELEMREVPDLNAIKMPSVSPTKSKIDPNLTAHLQRLSQLIDGLKQTYQKQETPSSDLRPDQLNAFLAHHNIKSEFNVIPLNMNESMVPQSPEKITSNPNIVTLLFNKNNYSSQMNYTKNTNLSPETKVLLTNHGQNRRNGEGSYLNSQIVVNRPEGSFYLLYQHQTITHMMIALVIKLHIKILKKDQIINKTVSQFLMTKTIIP
uniref:Chitin-binding type-2 domain-containing protein n=1 Tax=Megaselia scalaris TaxID=36166 RepID=T1H4L2_MEGSC